MNTQPEVLIVLGLGKDKKPRAATFETKDAMTVEAGAAHMGFKIAWAKTPEALTLAGLLPKGKVFASGDGLVPLVKPDTYQLLLKLVTLIDPKPVVKAEPSVKGSPKAPPADLWAAIKVGSTVLCRDDNPGPDRSWWECTVTAVSKDLKTLTLRWTKYPKLPIFTIRRNAVAILPPKA